MAREGDVAVNEATGERAVFRGGQWVLQAAAPAAAPPAGGVPGAFVPARRDPLKEAKDRADLNRTQTQDRRDEATLPYDVRKAAADAAKAEAEAEAAAAAGRDKPIVDPAIAQAIKGLSLDELLQSVAAARKEIGTGRATGVTGALLGALPGTSRQDLLGSLDSIKGAVIMEKLQALKDASKTGASGMGALSEREGDRLAASVAALGPNMSDEKLLEGLATIERHAKMLQAVGAGKNPEDPAVAKQFGIIAERPDDRRPTGAAGGTTPGGGSNSGGGGGSGGLALSTDGTKVVRDPALAGANARVVSMIKAGRSAGEIRGYLETLRPGLGRQVNNLEAWIAYHNANPGKPIAARIDETTVPLTPQESLINSAAQSFPGALAIGAADMLSGGTLDNMTENPALTRAGMAGVAEAQGPATLAGQVLGAALPGVGIEAGLSRLVASKALPVLAGDILPGVAYGAGSADEGSRLGGAAAGGFAGLIGGAGGRALGRTVSGVIDPAVRRLNAAGVRMTLPQMLGGAWKGAEDRLAGMPGFRGIINGARTRGIEDGDRAVFKQAIVEPAQAYAGDQIGETGVNNLDDAVGAAYDAALGGRAVQIDPDFTSDWGALTQALPNIPRVGDELRAAIAETVGPMFDRTTGQLSGESMQAIDRGLSKLHNAYVDDPLYATHIGPALNDANDAVIGMFARQAPDVMPAYRAAKQSYRNLSVISDAVNAAVNTDGRFTAAQLGTVSRNNAKKFGGSIAAAKGNRPFFQLQRDMQNVLPSKIPDPGTAGQLVLPGALAVLGGGVGGGSQVLGGSDAAGAAEGTGIGMAGGLAGAAALASPYVARGLIQKALAAERPRALQITGDIIGRSRLPGSLALPLLLSGGQ